MAVQSGDESQSHIKLNAGPDYIMKSNDICFYLSISKEENSSLMVNTNYFEDDVIPEDGTITEQISKKILFTKRNSSVTTKIACGPKGKHRLSKINQLKKI